MADRDPFTILYVITDLETGGVPLHLYRLATHVQRHGHAVHVTCLGPPGPVSDQLLNAGTPTTACGARGVWDLWALYRLRKIIRKIRPDIVHAMLFHANMACRAMALTGALPRRRLICEIQTVEIERRWHLLVDRFTQRATRFVVGNSPSVADHLARHARIDPTRLVLVHGGIDARPYREAQPASRAEFELADDVPLLIWTGRLDPVKGLDDLVDAVARVNRTQPVQLLLVGDGEQREALQLAVRESGASDHIRFAGRRDDVPQLLRMADAFVFPSLTEGLPNALLEAMAAGLPVIATDVPGNRDLIEANATGLLVPARDRAALADAIVKIMNDKSLAERLTANGTAAIDTRFDIAYAYAGYLALYARTRNA
jgi:glycosyltransferase involved in cell wall biosynthesis